MPEEFLAEAKEEQETIPLTLLRQTPPDVYRLSSGDVLGVWIEGVLGDREKPPPVNLVEQGDSSPAIGYPIPVRENGTIALPLVDPVRVQGLTIPEAEQAMRNAYTMKKQILRPDRERIIVTLMRPRRHRVLVIRQDSGGLTLGTSGAIGSTKRGTGYVVDLPAYENDVLNALAKTGGLPGLDAGNEVIIQRRYNGKNGGPALPAAKPGDANANLPPNLTHGLESFSPKCYPMIAGVQVIRIPLRVHPGEPPPFSPEDVLLQTGDIVFIESRDTEVYYTGGLLPIGEYVLPRDYDLDVIEAIARVGGPIVNGGFNGNNLSQGTVVGGGLGGPSPSLLSVLRKTPGGGQVVIKVDLHRALRDPRERILVKPGDVLILQETMGEAIVRYFTEVFSFSAFRPAFSRGGSESSSSLTLP